MESYFVMGKRQGEERFYYPNGKVYYKGLYANDLKTGAWEYFTEQGSRDTIIHYK